MNVSMETIPKTYRPGLTGGSFATKRLTFDKELETMTVPTQTALSAKGFLSMTTSKSNVSWSKPFKLPTNVGTSQLQKNIDRNQALDTLFPNNKSIFSFGSKPAEGVHPNKYTQSTTNVYVQNQNKSVFGNFGNTNTSIRDLEKIRDQFYRG